MLRVAGTAGARRDAWWDDAGVLRELRGSHGGPHAGTRLLALVLALLLAAPLTVFLWRVVASALDGLL